MSKQKLVKPLSIIAFIGVLFLVPVFNIQSYIFHVLIIVLINIILACSLRFIATTGQLSLGHGGMASVGAYTSALLVTKLGFSFWAALPLAGLTAMIIAFLVGYPFVRLKGIYFAMATLFLAEFFQLTAAQWKSLTGGHTGIQGISRPYPIVIPGLLNVDFASRVDFYYLALVMGIVTLLILYAIESSRIGMTFSSVQQSDSLSESIGVNTSRFKVLAFTIGSFFAGLVGAFYSQYFSCIVPSSFSFSTNIYIVIYMVVGGIRKFHGPIIGAFLLTVVSEMAGEMKEFEPFVLAGILLLIILFFPEGLVGLPQRLNKIVKKRFSHA
jgi:branched-chain amino acid transport system permease protein